VTRREEDIPEFAKPPNEVVIERKFDQDKSMFKAWIADDPSKMAGVADLDFKYFKVQGMIKDEDDKEGVMDILRKHMGRLKDIFINLSSYSAYPCVTVLDFSTFAAKTKIFDKHVNIGAVDIAFTATNFKAKDQA